MNWTKEQLNIFNTIEQLYLSGKQTIVKIEAVAGSGKTSTMVEMASRLTSKYSDIIIDYLTFGRALADEAKRDFKHNAKVSNIHQLAYHHMIRAGDMELSNKPYLDISDYARRYNMPFLKQKDLNIFLKEYFKSTINDVDEFIDEFYLNDRRKKNHLWFLDQDKLSRISKHIINDLEHGILECTHDSYLKIFLNNIHKGGLTIGGSDILIIDEAEDLSPVMKEIFDNYDATIKILIGDRYQSTLSFLDCINMFDLYDDAIELKLTNSFRCSPTIARRVEHFMQTCVDKDFRFVGLNNNTPTDKSFAYLTRLNSTIIEKSIECKNTSRSFTLSADNKIDSIFGLAINLYTLTNKKNRSMASEQYKWICDEYDYVDSIYFDDNDIFKKYKEHIIEKYGHNDEITKSYTLIETFGIKELVETYKYAKQNKDIEYRILTAYTSKGLTVDTAYINNDLNSKVGEVISKINDRNLNFNELIKEDKELLMLYYVACTRPRFKLLNAELL